MRLLLAAAAALTFVHCSPAQSGQSGANREVTFGIVPQQSASRLARMWGPVLDELSSRTGMTFRFRTTKDIPTFEACLAAGAFDFAYMNPMHYTIFSQEAAYRAIAHQEGKRLKGVMVARADSAFADLSSLAGQRIAFPSPGAFGASILNRASLQKEGVEFTPSYVKSHDSVYRAVAAGLMAAGGGVTRTWNAVDPEVRAQLRVIYETDGYTPHAVAVHQSVADDLAQIVQEELLLLSEAYPELVKAIGMKGFVQAKDSDWDDVRALGMAREDTGISKQGDVECPSG
ncbi:phosphate/phosphite/phosphonate ABC transporter substrate-binding protein [Leisingera sp. ANG-M1]|uniref:phosphate/phosphite/phosphonate ABC transporter substrate-binding protein n=1 Tax=Leisingera sp. ANG-M1 TaxID=1577895 RepID=UPI0009E3B357|nr:phosphate/phosphite/phosphonate ABC transporter substrate-binding protein [Leisingera sp. ANG-M1]